MPFNLRLKDYITLFRVAQKRLDSPEAYRSFQHFQGELLVKFLQSHRLNLRNHRVLDLGCGFGGYSIVLKETGAQVISADLSPSDSAGELEMFCADAQCLPLADKSVDLIICASLIEHVQNPAQLLREIYRVLRVDGWVYLSFPPFYTPIGGHQFSPFHLLGERTAIKMQRGKAVFKNKEWLQERYPEAPNSFAQAFGDWGLYPLTISKVEKLLHEIPFQIFERSTRWLPIDFSGIPILREFLTWHVQFLLYKPASKHTPK